MEISIYRMSVLVEEMELDLKVKRKIDWSFLWDMFKDVFQTMCIDTMTLYDKNDEAVNILYPDNVFECNDIAEYKSYLKEEGVDLRSKYRWDMVISDYNDCEVELIYDPFSNKKKNMIRLKITASPDLIIDIENSFKEIDGDDSDCTK